ncbi:MAG: hypothetical protein ABI186_06955 [Candidatus Elarobacter sp.]
MQLIVVALEHGRSYAWCDERRSNVVDEPQRRYVSVDGAQQHLEHPAPR